MNILLASPYFKTYKRILPPLGLGYIVSALEKKGYNVDIKDFQVEYMSIQKAARQIVDMHYDAVGISAITDNRFNAIELIKLIKYKNNNIFIFVGGPHFDATAVDALDKVKEIDVVVRGEGEITTCELLDAYFNNKRFDNILGITYRDESGRIRENPIRPFIYNLDELQPAWHKFKMQKYNYPFDDSGLPFIGIISSRGCIYNCAFCSNATPKIHFRNPKNFIYEIEYLKNRYGYKRFIFLDSTFTVNHRHLTEICNLILERDLKIKWQAGARVDSVNRQILKLMRDAGCFRITYGIESGNARILKEINKSINIDQVQGAIHLSSELGFEISAFFMVGLPSEGLFELKETIKLMKELGSYKGCQSIYGFTVIYPKTEIERIALERNLLPKDFSWNTYRIFPKYILTDTSKTVPYYQEKLRIETIKLQIIINNYSLSWHSFRIIFYKVLSYLRKLFSRTFVERT